VIAMRRRKKIYGFYWWGIGKGKEEMAYAEIEAPKQLVEKLLDEYRNKDPYYNLEGWYDFLEKKHIKIKPIFIDEIPF
jgi:hypothetical protein